MAGIIHDVPVLLLCIIASVSAVHLSLRADLGQLGPGFDFNAPALVICQMKVQPIQLVMRDHVNVALYIIHAEEVARHIQHRAAPPESGGIAYRNSGQADSLSMRHGQELTKSLDAVK